VASVTKDIGAVAGHLFSKNRRYKAGILAREAMLRLQPFAGRHAVDADLPPDPPPETWHQEQGVPIDPAFFNVRTKAATDDHLGEDGLVHTVQDHEIRILYGAYSYTNESTHRTIFDRHGDRIERLSYARGGKGGPSRLRVAADRTIPGRTVNLYSNKACSEGNYAHWLLDALAHLFMIERFHSLDSIDQVLVPRMKHDFQWDSLAAFGFTPDRVVELPPLECLRFECLLASSAPRGRSSSVAPGWAIDRYHDVLVAGAKAVPSVAGKRVYISRRDAPNRKFLNEDELCEVLEKRGYDIVELTPLNLDNKIAVFRDAEHLIGQTGAGLTNLMFGTPGAAVMELVDKRFVDHLYASLAAYRGVRHSAHFFENETPLGRLNSIVARSAIDIPALEHSLDAAGM